MKLSLENDQPLDLAKDFELNIQLTNPLLTDQGSMSLPLKLPSSDNNLRLLDFPNRHDRYYKIKKKQPALIEVGIMQKQAILEIMSFLGDDDGIESVLLLNEAKMYTKMQEVDMSSAFKVIRDPEYIMLPGTFDTPMDKLIKYLELVMLGQIHDSHLLLFPVATEHSDQTFSRNMRGDYTVQVFNILNERMSVYSREGIPEYMLDQDLNGKPYYVFRGRKPFTVKTGNDEFEAPKGYGITPFLRENYVLRQIFEYFGYVLAESIFDTDPDLSRMVLVNNTADAIVRGVIDYSQLVPDCTIHEYLETVRARFGCEFFVSEDHKTVVPIFWKDILKSQPQKDYSAKVAGEPVIDYVTPKELKLCYKRSLEFATSSIDTLEKFKKNYGPIKAILPYRYAAATDALYDGFYFIASECAIYELNEQYKKNDGSGRGTNGDGWRYIMRAMFDYYTTGEDVEYEEIKSDLEYTPLIDAYIKYSEDPGIHYDGYDVYPLRVLYIGNSRHLNTAMEVTVANENGQVEKEQKKEDPGSCPIMAAFWVLRDNSFTLYADQYAMGTMHRYNHKGEAVGQFDLTFGGADGLYNHFWKEYNEVLKNSFLKLTYDINFDEKDIVDFRMDELVCIDGQLLLPELLEYTVSRAGVVVNKIEFRTVRLYEDIP